MKRSQAWKDFEREVAKRLGGTRRVERGADWSVSTDDVELADFPWKVDCKYRSQPFKHHGMLSEIRRKYCRDGSVAVLVTKNAREHGAVVSMSLDDFAGVVTALRAVRE